MISGMHSGHVNYMRLSHTYKERKRDLPLRALYCILLKVYPPSESEQMAQ